MEGRTNAALEDGDEDVDDTRSNKQQQTGKDAQLQRTVACRPDERPESAHLVAEARPR